MPVWLKFALQVLFFSVIVIIGYTILKVYVLEKININKWLVLALSIFVLIFPVLIKVNINGTIWQYVQSAIVIVLTLWFLDLIGIGAGSNPKNKKDDVVIRPKAKPNRVKNIKKHDSKKK
ncbi:hypothetical protein ACQX0N_11140 [Clostridium tepidum]|jgi:Flp pilus assembly protein protease CpaA|uniref:Uncharacterized protein n=1 Tax=Clostridium tepidum TaxID=1962263 RepID=A0A1S9I0B8_9CLOT|nr:hypothetical protein [Clostridium tepidum]MCR1934610.1 hypothetical protein [Clostridium tepidum]MDU6877644.1 hypothetical protein [Clostridium botulinum]OOO62513.1 hypothetical protein BS637_06655 [Clostridium tepidum]OOO63776.1 hypothetical protein BS638_13615 [Clostridium tepidum]